MDFDSFGPMKLWNRFRDDWIVTPSAAKLFFCAAIVAAVITPVVLGYVQPSGKSGAANVFWNLFGAASPFAVFFIWIGMWRYWARIDPSPKWVRRFWFVILLAGFWCGSVLYYFLMYLPQCLKGQNERNFAPAAVGKPLRGFASILIGGWALLLVGTLLTFILPKMSGFYILFRLSICLVLFTVVYIAMRLYRLGMNRRRT